MNALLIIAHGSRREESNGEITALAGRLQAQLGEFDAVGHGFLELAEPDIGSAVHSLAGAGVSTITIFPYFLVAGRHVAEDIPEIIAGLTDRYPRITFHLLDYFGAGPGIDELVVNQLRQLAQP